MSKSVIKPHLITEGRTMFNSRSIRATILSVALASPAFAQDSTSDRQPTQLELRSAFSISFVQARPQGAFGANVGLGYGLSGAYLFRIDRAGILSIRADLGVVDYGNDAERAALSSTVGGRVQVNVRTTNYIVPVTVGPQLMWPTGRFRPYVNAGVGGQGFVTESHVEDVNHSESFASTTNQSDFAASWSAGGGIYTAVYSGKANVSIDLGVQYMNGGTARYLSRGSIVDLPDGKVSITPLSSATHLMVVRAGLRIGL
jgi:opacity protein-like surface antigen